MSGLVADLRTLIPGCVLEFDMYVSEGGGVGLFCCHRSVIWVRIPHLRASLSDASQLALPTGVGLAAFKKALYYIYGGRLRPADLPMDDATMNQLLLLSAAWDFPILCGGSSGGLFGVSKPEVETIRRGFAEAFSTVDQSPGLFLDVCFHCTATAYGEPEPEPEPTHQQSRTYEPVHASKTVLCCRSGFFQVMLGGNTPWSEAQQLSSQRAIEICVDRPSFVQLVHFAHTDEFPGLPLKAFGAAGGGEPAVATEEVEHALAIASYFDVPALFEYCSDWIIKQLSVETACELWALVENSSLGALRMPDELRHLSRGAKADDTDAEEEEEEDMVREDLLGNPSELIYDFVLKYFGAVMQTPGFLGGAMSESMLRRLLGSGLVAVGSQELAEAVEHWATAEARRCWLRQHAKQEKRRQQEQGGTVGGVEEPSGDADSRQQPPQQAEAPVTVEANAEEIRHKEALRGSLMPPATLFNRTVRDGLLGVGAAAQSGPRSLV